LRRGAEESLSWIGEEFEERDSSATPEYRLRSEWKKGRIKRKSPPKYAIMN
jgi:hypothetical protein